jgi:hypothetical protein
MKADELYLKEFISKRFPGNIEDVIKKMDIILRLDYRDCCTILELDFNNMSIEHKTNFFIFFFEWKLEINTFGISINTFRNIHNDWKNLCENRNIKHIKYSSYTSNRFMKKEPLKVYFE